MRLRRDIYVVHDEIDASTPPSQRHDSICDISLMQQSRCRALEGVVRTLLPTQSHHQRSTEGIPSRRPSRYTIERLIGPTPRSGPATLDRPARSTTCSARRRSCGPPLATRTHNPQQTSQTPLIHSNNPQASTFRRHPAQKKRKHEPTRPCTMHNAQCNTNRSPLCRRLHLDPTRRPPPYSSD